jgi:predicted DNA-binding transcriptional regulator YafY
MRCRSTRQLLALRIVQEKGSISSQEYIDASGVPERTALRELRDMVDRGVFVVHGRARNTRYYRAS